MILLCVTVSVVTAGTGAPAVIGTVFAVGAKTAAVAAASGAVIGATGAGIVKYLETGDMEASLKEAALGGSEGFKWGAITGAVIGIGSEATSAVSSMFSSTPASSGGLAVQGAAKIQQESKLPAKIIKKLQKKETYEKLYKYAKLFYKIIAGKNALLKDVDPDRVDESTGMTNLQRMKNGMAAVDENGNVYHLYYIGDTDDMTIAMMTPEEHDRDESGSWKEMTGTTDAEKELFKELAKDFWNAMWEMYEAGQ